MHVPIGNIILMFCAVPVCTILLCYSDTIKQSGLGTVASIVVISIIMVPMFLLRNYLLNHVGLGGWGNLQKEQMEIWGSAGFVADIISMGVTYTAKSIIKGKKAQARGQGKAAAEA